MKTSSSEDVRTQTWILETVNNFSAIDTFAAAQLVDTSSQCTFFRKKCHIEIGSTRYEHIVQSNEKYSDVTNRPSARARVPIRSRV